MYSDRMVPINPVFRICTAVLCILLCSLSHNASFTLLVSAGEICLLALLPAGRIANVLRSVITAVLLAFLITLPAVFLGSPASCLTISMKVMESVMIIAVLNETCGWKEMTGSLQELHVPGVVIMTMDLTIHFLVILARFSNQMLEAVSVRAVGDTSWKDSQIGGILGTTFLKSERLSDRTSEAMVCRGFAGEYQMYQRHHLQIIDLLYLMLPAALVILFVYLEKTL